jgi:hypothetical protein
VEKIWAGVRGVEGILGENFRIGRSNVFLLWVCCRISCLKLSGGCWGLVFWGFGEERAFWIWVRSLHLWCAGRFFNPGAWASEIFPKYVVSLFLSF